MLDTLNVSSPDPPRGNEEETNEPGEDSSVKIKRSLYDLFYRL